MDVPKRQYHLYRQRQQREARAQVQIRSEPAHLYVRTRLQAGTTPYRRRPVAAQHHWKGAPLSNPIMAALTGSRPANAGSTPRERQVGTPSAG